MISNICRIENGTKDLAAILKESERVAEYNGFTHKQTLQLRLLCEEVDGMLPNLIDDFDGTLWIEYEEGVCKVNVAITIPEFNTGKKEELVGIAKNKKNAAAVGIVGKIRDAIENFFLAEEVSGVLDATPRTFYRPTGYSEGVDYDYLWTLDQYRSSVKKDTKNEDWDELEKSVIASVADDVVVSVKGRQANITIVKKFA